MRHNKPRTACHVFSSASSFLIARYLMIVIGNYLNVLCAVLFDFRNSFPTNQYKGMNDVVTSSSNLLPFN
jgi:hypothetical protein